MTQIVWDTPSERRYEAGLDKGVLFLQDGTGVAWNGLTSVDEKPSVKITPLYFDGHKHNDIVTPGDFQATLRAFTYPDEFAELEGVHEVEKGMFAYDQPQQRFNLCYRTWVGNAVEGQYADYKLHIIYNAIAKPSSKNYSSLNDSPGAMEFGWSITSVPQSLDGYTATAHVAFDTRHMDPLLLRDIEEIIYGTEATDPMLPSLQALSAYIRKWARVVIDDNGDGTWTATAAEDGQIIDNGDGTFTIVDANTTNETSTQFDISSSVADTGDL